MDVEIFDLKEVFVKIGGEIKIGMKVKICIFFIGGGDVEISGIELGSNERGKIYKVIDYNLVLF